MDLQHEINIAVPGATIQIPDNERCVGSFTIDKPLTIHGGLNSSVLTPSENQVTFTAQPAFNIPPGTGPVVLRKLNISVTDDVKKVFDLIRYGGSTLDSGQTSLDKCPQGLWLDECDIFGLPTTESQRGVSANGANFKATKTKIREIHGKGYDTQAICSWNGPGPFLIEDCYLEAAGENVMFGGSEAIIPNLIPSNIEIRRTHFYKPLAWKGVWTVKNLFELKNAKDVLVDECVFENCWVDAQSGYGLVFTVRGETWAKITGVSKNPWATVQNVTVQNSMVRNCESGVLTLGLDELPEITTQGRNLRLYNCKFEGLKNWFFVLQRFDDVTIEHCTHEQASNIIVFTGIDANGPIKSKNFTYRNNVTTRNPIGYGFKADGGGEGTAALDQFCDGWTVQGNVIAGATERLYPANNYFPADLSALSGFKGTDGQVPGYVSATIPAPTQPDPIPTEPTPSTPMPTTSPDGTKGTSIVDGEGKTWTIGSNRETLRDGVQMGGGQGTLYKYLDKIVHVSGLDRNWWAWTGLIWSSVGATEPGTTQPIPEPPPVLPEPPPPSLPPRSIRWPNGIADQMALIQTQALESYRPSGRQVPRPANMPKGNYVEFVGLHT